MFIWQINQSLISFRNSQQQHVYMFGLVSMQKAFYTIILFYF